MHRSKDDLKSCLFFHNNASRTGTQVARHDNKCFYILIHMPFIIGPTPL